MIIIEDASSNKESNDNDNSCWRRRTHIERVLICTLIVAVLVIIVLAVAAAVQTSSTKGDRCLTNVCIKEAANLLNRMNLSVDPCDNFYKFVCGRYVEESQIPEDKMSLDALGVISDLINFQVKSVITEPSSPNEIRPFAMIKKMYRACMNVTDLESTSLDQMKSFLTSLGGWPVLEQDAWVETDWVDLTRKLRKYGFSTSHFLTIDVDINAKNSTEFVVFIDEAKNDEINENNLKNGLEDDLVQLYAEYLVDLAVMFGAQEDFATKEVHDVINYRASLAKFIVSKSEHYKLLINANVTTILELQKMHPTIKWLELINGALAVPNTTLTETDKVALVSPKFIAQFEEIVGNTSKRVQVNHALFEAVRSSINYLPIAMRKREQEFMASATGTTESRKRWHICTDRVTNDLNIAIDALYIQKYGNDTAIDDVTEMVSHIKQVFVNILSNIEWMDSETKEKAIEKAGLITSHVGYAQELRDNQNIVDYYHGLKFESTNILQLISEISTFKRDKVVSRYGKPVVKNYWSNREPAITSNAFYDPQENSIHIPFGIMQKEFYTKGRPNYMNYGGLGLVIGHEMTHGFDNDGKWFNKMGDVMNWWKESTDEAFSSRAKCFIKQYSNYTVPEINVNIDGENTLAENIADNGGIKEAYLAYMEWIKQNKPEPPLPGFSFSDKQLFWISLTNAWCTKHRKSSMEQIVLGDDHSPSQYRILGALSNSEDFAKDFKCPVGSNMNPAKKCQMW